MSGWVTFEAATVAKVAKAACLLNRLHNLNCNIGRTAKLEATSATPLSNRASGPNAFVNFARISSDHDFQLWG